MKTRITTLILLLLSFTAGAFDLVSKGHVAPLVIAPGEPDYLILAAKDMASDVERITGRRPQVITDGTVPVDGAVVIGTVTNPRAMDIFHKLNHDKLIGLEDKWEAYRVLSHKGEKNMFVAGSDARGTMFGIYDFCENYLKVDPLYAWSGILPEKQNVLSWESFLIKQDEPSFKFRGWFINDEDLLTHWMESGGERHIDYTYYKQVVNVRAMEMLAEALVRSRFNLIIPASFMDVMNPPEKALLDVCVRRGVFLSQHHIEPMGVSGYTFFNYWKERGHDYKFSYFSHPDELKEVWTAYAKKWAEYPDVIWQIGLRGIADRPMWMADPDTPQSDAERGRLISEAMEVQRKIVDEVTGGKARYVSTTLWAEGSVLNQQGALKIPGNTMVVFADNSPGWRWQNDFYETERKKDVKYGVYYHHGLIGCGPHLAQGVPPHKTFEMLRTAMGHGAGTYAIFNVSNIREFVLGIGATSAMTWRLDEFNPDEWLEDWTKERFSVCHAEIANAYRIYFNAFRIHDLQKVPFMLDGQMFHSGRSVLSGIQKKLKLGQIGTGTSVEKISVNPESENSEKKGDAFLEGLNDMHPKSAGRRSNIISASAQRTGFELACIHADLYAKELPEPEAVFLRDNLCYPAHFMERTTLWLQNLLIAAEALDMGDLPACSVALGEAEDAFDDIPVLAEAYCHDIWKEWYRGCRKLNISDVLAKTQEAARVAKKMNSVAIGNLGKSHD